MDADLIPFERFSGDPLAGLAFQRELESQAFRLGVRITAHRCSGSKTLWPLGLRHGLAPSNLPTSQG